MEKKRGMMEEDGISFEAWYCHSCQEELLTMPQLKSLAKEYRKLRKAKEIRFAKWGNSIAIRIPQDIVEAYQIKEGKHALLIKDKEGIRIIPTV